MQMRSGTPTGTTDFADYLPPFDVLLQLDQYLALVCIQRHKASTMIDLDYLTVPTHPSGIHHPAIIDRPQRRPPLRTKIDSKMGAILMKDRMPSPIRKTGSDTRVIQWHPETC